MNPDGSFTTSPRRPPARARKWYFIAFVSGVVLIGLCSLAFVSVVLKGSSTTTWKPPISTPVATPAQAQGTAPIIPKSVVIKGKNNSAQKMGVVLNGAFTVEYSFGSWCGIAHFLTANGDNGAGTFENINECAADVNDKAVGSTVVHLENVTMVKVENTSGNWSLKFTPLG